MIVPSRHYKAVLEELHESHPGMTQIKSVENMFFFIFIFIFIFYGGLGLMETLKELFSYDKNVRQVCRLHILVPFNHRTGLPSLCTCGEVLYQQKGWDM